eukprot:144770_1
MGQNFDCGIFTDQTADNGYNMDSDHKQIHETVPVGAGRAVLSEQLGLFLSCTNLPKLDLMSPSDPFIVIYHKMEKDKDKSYEEIAKTELIQDNPNPEFTKPIIIDYHFEEVQFIKLDIYDADGPDLTRLSKHDFVGSCEFILADLVNQHGSTLKMNIKSKKGKKIDAMCVIRSEEIKTNHDLFSIQFECKDLEKLSWFSSPNPYLQIYRQANDTGGWMSVLRTKRFNDTQHAVWKTMKIPIQRLCNSDYGRPILIKCFHDTDGAAPEPIGQCETSLQALLDETSKPLTHPTRSDKVCGTLLFHSQEIIKRHGFLEYVMGGMNIEMMIAVDFTGSNGDPQEDTSLHYIGPPKYESPYMKALRSVGRVLEPYDTDHMIHAYGFGANLNPNGQKNVSHCFNLTLTDEDTVHGIEGVLQTYVSCINKIQLFGPTNFAEIIETCASVAASKTNDGNEQNYVILLMVTDGIITDMKRTKDAIVHASTLPLSIIIVGVGNADFDAMDELDADDEPLVSSQYVPMQRDIVQFVPFNKHKDGNIGLLAKAVLEEVPGQITGYMAMNKLHPLRRDDDRKQQDVMGVYDGPSAIIRNGTDYVQNMHNQPMNPYYSNANTAQDPQQQPTGAGVPGAGFNPAVAASAPVNPYYPNLNKTQDPAMIIPQQPTTAPGAGFNPAGASGQPSAPVPTAPLL